MNLSAPHLLTIADGVERFRCGTPALDEWLKRRAMANQISGASRTYAVTDTDVSSKAYHPKEFAMQALRYVTESINHQVIIQLPPELDCQRLEIIVLPLGENIPAQTAIPARRKPSPLLAGSVVMTDDLIVPAAPEEAWDALK